MQELQYLVMMDVLLYRIAPCVLIIGIPLFIGCMWRGGVQYTLGWMHATGRGVVKDERKAVEWYRKAAGQRWSVAQVIL